jgi:hypothetical protein
MRETRISVPMFRHTTLVVDDVENGYDEATTNIEDLRRRFEKTLSNL